MNRDLLSSPPISGRPEMGGEEVEVGVWAIASQGQALTPPPRLLRSHPSPQGEGKQHLRLATKR